MTSWSRLGLGLGCAVRLSPCRGVQPEISQAHPVPSPQHELSGLWVSMQEEWFARVSTGWLEQQERGVS